MSKFIFFLFLLPLLLCSTEVDIWSIWTYEPSEKLTNQVKITQGKFTKIEIYLQKFAQEGNPTPELVSLKLIDENSMFKMSSELVQIDTTYTRRVIAYIGMSCDVIFDTSKTYTVRFEVDDEEKKDYYISNDIQINVINKSEIEYELQISQEKIPSGAFGMIFGLEELNNVDPILLSFISTNADTGDEVTNVVVDPITISPFNPNNQNRHIKTKYYAKNKDVLKVKLTAKDNSNCYAFTPTAFTVEVTDDTFSDTTNKKASIIGDVTLPSTLNVKIQSQIYPSMLYCVIINEEMGFPSNENIRQPPQNYDTSSIAFFNNFFVENVPVDNQIIRGLNRENNYKYKCIFENNAESRVDKTKVTTSTFESLSSFSLKSENSFYTKCATWLIKKTAVDVEKIKNSLLSACNNAFIIDTVAYEENGCVKCREREIDNVYDISEEQIALSFCAESTGTCTSKFAGDEAATFENFVRSLDSSEKIKSKLGIDITVDNVLKEVDAVPDEDDIEVNFISQNEKNLLYSVSSSLSYPIKCLSAIKQVSEMIGDIKGNDIIVKSNEKEKENSVTFPTDVYDDRDYALYLQCYSAPNANLLMKSLTIKAFSIKHADFAKRCKDPEAKLTDAYCIDFDMDVYPTMKTENPIDDNTELILELKSKKNYKSQLNYINEIVNKTSQEPKPIDFILKEIARGSELLQYVNCKNELYEDCVSSKEAFQYEIWKNLNKLVDFEHLDTVVDKNDVNTAVNVLKLLPISLFFSFNSAEVMKSDKGLEYVINLLSKLELTLKKLDEKIDAKANKKDIIYDIVNLFISMGVNSFKVEPYCEVNFVYMNQVNETTYLIHNTMLTNLFAQILDNLKILNKIKENVKGTGFEYYYKSLAASRLRRLDDVDFDAEGIEINIPENAKDVSASEMSIVIIKNVPMLSIMGEGKISNTFVVVSLFNDTTEIQTNMLKDFEIEYDLSKYNKDFKYCYNYNQNNVSFDTEDLTSKSDEKKTKCVSKHTGVFTIGNVDLGGSTGGSDSQFWLIMLIVILAVVVVSVVAFMIVSKTKSTSEKKSNLALVETGTPTADEKPTIQMTDLKD